VFRFKEYAYIKVKIMQKKVSLILSEWMKNEIPSWKDSIKFSYSLACI